MKSNTNAQGLMQWMKFVKDITNSDSKIHISMSSEGDRSAILKPLN